jgi:hypothetical protein
LRALPAFAQMTNFNDLFVAAVSIGPNHELRW